ncbi:uncharacterized protein BXZ73DRAFT_107756 [Epithele typhae]|uniref:uncharacterized protein n=1 Tax=Epithele typhae TaxID=378194 RepID=UPI0020083524|nr:uncharacterized protein BXZ73DRAFT_107756 [Epithele typhae]KAH9911924.1 hypothetical protein BXZ73DRAFT_107756 [Epithele typhae]
MSNTVTDTLPAGTLPKAEEYRLQLTKALADPAVRSAASAGVKEGLKAAAAREAMEKEIEDLGDTTRVIKEGFTAVANEVARFDAAGFKDAAGQPTNLSQVWKALSDRFDDSLTQSHDLASAAVAVLRMYSKTILNRVHLGDNVDELKENLRKFEAEIAAKAKEAAATRTSFITLATDVRAFGNTLQKAMETAGVQLAKELQEANRQVEELGKKLSEISQEIQSLTSAAGGIIAKSAACAFAALTIICPIFCFGVFGFAFVAMKKEAEINDLRNKHRDVETQRTEQMHKVNVLMAQQALLMQFQASLPNTTERVNSLAAKIDTIAHVWQILRSDMIQLKTDLSLAGFKGGDNEKANEDFLDTIGITRDAYLHLAHMFELYAKGF